MVGWPGGQRVPVTIDFTPGLPEAIAVGQAVEPTFGIEAWLLQRFLGSGYTLRRPPVAAGIAHAAHQPGDGPGLCRAVPFDPRQALAIGADSRRGVEVGALGQDFAAAVTQSDQAMLYLFGMALFDGQHLAVVPELPKTPAGKVHRKKLREQELAAVVATTN